MKLSEAVMLPSEVKFDPSLFLSKGRGCLLGQAMNVATGKTDCRVSAIIQQWPWLTKSFHAPLEIQDGERWPSMIIASGESIITRYAFMVEAGLLTREQCADWIRSVEPPEPTSCEATVVRHCEDSGELCGKKCEPGKHLCEAHYVE